MVTMQVHVDGVFKGKVDDDGMVYVELVLNGWPVDDFNKAIPSGTKVGLYLNPSAKEGGEIVIGNDDAGLPPGATIYAPADSQGIILATDNAGVVMPINGRQMPDTALGHMLP